ncbi:MAG: class I SAM-dependent RNA methyltransferase [Alphaproteobacteria bacterium]|nr:class I SAM-dependent RNA methyltransferase [Alphaproteobacteria bacterium]
MPDIAELAITEIGRRGDGLAALDGAQVFVPRTVPGDRVRARISGTPEDGLRGEIVELLEAGPWRAAPPCPYFETCGSCQLQHIGEDAYRSWKENLARVAFARAGIKPETWLPPVFVSRATRRRATFAAFKRHKELRLGYRRRRSHDIIDIPECMVVTPALQAFADRARSFLHRVLSDSRPADIFVQDVDGAVDVTITGPVGTRKAPGLAEREAFAEMADALDLARISWRMKDRSEPEIMIARKPVLKRCGDLAVPLSPLAFLQPSAEGEAALVAAVLRGLPSHGRFVDLFAGSGTFAGPILARGRVSAIEGEAGPVAALQRAGAGNGHLQAVRRDLFRDPLGAREFAAFNAAVIDPPRAGARAQAAELAASGVERVVSVSCNPATFARDAALLMEGGYHFVEARMIDQFLWSAHVELVGVFSRVQPD